MDDLFGGMFDLNDDSTIDSIEAGLGYMIMDDILRNKDVTSENDADDDSW